MRTEADHQNRRPDLEAQHFDCVVVGGGPAGCAAACTAASHGCKTLLIERHGFLGGMGTAASLSCFINYRYGPRDLSGRFYRQVIADLATHHATYQAERGNADIFEPEIAKMVLEQRLISAGGHMVFHSSIESVMRVGNGWTLGVFHKSGSFRVNAGFVIDATGDADVAEKAGANMTYGRSSDGLSQPLTMVTQLGGADPAAFQRGGGRLVDGRFIIGSSSFVTEIVAARLAGEWSIPRKDVAMFWSMPLDPTRVSINGTRIRGGSACRVDDITFGEREGRRQGWELAHFFAKYIPGFANSYLSQTGPQVGVRESRRIIGRETLTTESVLLSVRPADSITFCSYPIDVHQPDGDDTDFDNEAGAFCYGIPYGCLLPVGLENFLAAGRCISASHEAAGSFRVMSTCMNLGEAAGMAVAIARQSGLKVSDISGVAIADRLTVAIGENRNLGSALRSTL